MTENNNSTESPMKSNAESFISSETGSVDLSVGHLGKIVFSVLIAWADFHWFMPSVRP